MKNRRERTFRSDWRRNLIPVSDYQASLAFAFTLYPKTNVAESSETGWNRYSVGYHSDDGFKSHSFPFTATSYGPPLLEGDTLGVGYRPRTGTVFFTRNGKKLEDAFIGFNKHNLFPSVGADGSCSIHVNLGQAGFVFIEANVKKWGLAPMVGSLAPPPAYGSERGSILLESAANAAATTSNVRQLPTSGSSSSSSRRGIRSHPPSTSTSRLNPSSSSSHNHRRRIDTSVPATPQGAASALASPSQPIRPSPLRHSRNVSSTFSTGSRSASDDGTARGNSSIQGGGGGSPGGGEREEGESRGEEGGDVDDEDDDIHNPPTPGLLDISLHSIHRFPNRVDESDEDDEDEEGGNGERRRRRRRTSGDEENSEDSEEDSDEDDGGEREEETLERRLLREVARERGETASTRSVSPPAYNPIDPHVSRLTSSSHIVVGGSLTR